MSKPQLYYTAISPPSRAVVTTAKLVNVELDLIETNLLKDEHLKAEFLKLNPQHTVPLLVDDGAVIYDSQAICAYLVGKYGKDDDPLYPKDLVKRAQVDARLHFNTGYLFWRLRAIVEPIVYYGNTSSIDKDKVEHAAQSYPILEAFLTESKYLCGDQLTIADICCESTICGAANLLVPIDSDKYPKLTAWRNLISAEIPDYEKDFKEGGLALQNFVLSKVSSA